MTLKTNIVKMFYIPKFDINGALKKSERYFLSIEVIELLIPRHLSCKNK